MSYEYLVERYPLKFCLDFMPGSLYERVNGINGAAAGTPLLPGGRLLTNAANNVNWGASALLDITDTTLPFTAVWANSHILGLSAFAPNVSKTTGAVGYSFGTTTGAQKGRVTVQVVGGMLEIRFGSSTVATERDTFVVTYDGSLLASGCRAYINGAAAAITVITNTLIAGNASSAAVLRVGGTAAISPRLEHTFAAFINQALTPAQCADLYKHLRTERPARIHPRRKFTATMPLRTQPEEIAAGYIYAASGGMANGKWPDQIQGLRNAGRVGPIDVAKSGPYCEHVANHGPIAASLTLPAGDTDIFNSNDWTWSCWLMVPAASATVRKIVQLDGTNYYIALDATEKVVVSNVNGAAAQVTTTSTAALITGKWYHVLVSRQMTGADMRVRILLDGTVDTDATSVGIGVTLPVAGDPRLAEGVMHVDAVRYRKAVVTSDSEARAECLQGGKKVLFDGRICKRGCCPVGPVAMAGVGVGLPGSPWDIQAGSARILEDPPMGSVLGMRRLQAVGVGHASTADIVAAYGSWYLVWKRPAAQSSGVVFVSNGNVLSTSSGWMARQDTNNRFVLFRMVAGGTISIFYTAIGYLVADTVYRCWVRRDRLGSIAVYVRGGAFATWTLVDPTGGSGTNPIVDNTYTASRSMILQLTAGTEYGDIIHYLTAMAPAEAIGLGILEP